MPTIKLYNEKPFLLECTSKVIEIVDQGIIIDKTISFPEGGGQIGDCGEIINKRTNKVYYYYDTQQINGFEIEINDFPNIKINSDIVHYIQNEYLGEFQKGDEVRITIDKSRRKAITANHTGIHLALMEFNKIRPGIDKKIRGAKINDKYGRLDFETDQKISKEELEIIKTNIIKLIERKEKINKYSHNESKEAIYWECDKYIVPCGGTHLTNTEQISDINVKRKNIGKGIDRLIVETTFSDKLEVMYQILGQ